MAPRSGSRNSRRPRIRFQKLADHLGGVLFDELTAPGQDDHGAAGRRQGIPEGIPQRCALAHKEAVTVSRAVRCDERGGNSPGRRSLITFDTGVLITLERRDKDDLALFARHFRQVLRSADPGDDVFAFVQKHSTKPVAERLYESHRKYIDVQFIYSGRETILWAPLPTMQEVTRPYEEEKDIGKWKLVADTTALHLSSGHFAILFPQDAHAPCVQWDQPEQVYKVVMKVAVE